MCGILGVVSSPDRLPSRERFTAALASLAHRGPDGEGVAEIEFGEEKVLLGHRRLSIIDLSHEADQPMRSTDGRRWVVFNGEIYNYRELRAELESAGRTFRTRSDTEVLLEGWEVWGEGLVPRLRGMFALVLVDLGRRRVLLARDHFGIKPLYLAAVGSGFAFASEVRALLELGIVPRTVDPAGLGAWIRVAANWSERTLVSGVTSFPAASLAARTAGEAPAARRFWTIERPETVPSRVPSPSEVPDAVAEAVDRAVTRQLVADVPVAAFLSGGVDSTLVAAVMARRYGGTPTFFNVSFEEAEFDEHPEAERTARDLGAEYRRIRLRAADVKDRFDEMVDRMDLPSADGFNTFVVSEAVAQGGAKVALSGLGGDELFGGYGSWPQARRLAAASVLAPAFRCIDAVAGDLVPVSFPGLGKRLQALAARSGGERYEAMRGYFPRRAAARLLGPARERFAFAPIVAEPSPGLGDVDRDTAFREQTGYLPGTLLRDTDVMSMAHALEVRPPLLDADLAGLLAVLPSRTVFGGELPKQLARDAAARFLGRPLHSRPKMGFSFPWRDWCRDLLGGRIGEIAELADRTGLVDGGEVRSLWRRFDRGEDDTLWSRLLALHVLVSWASRRGFTA